MPMFFITAISFQEDGLRKVEFGLACILGGVAFSLSFVPAFAFWANWGLLCGPDRNEAPIDLKSVHKKERLMLHIIRDIMFILSALGLYYVFLPTGKIFLWQVAILLGLFVIYIIVFILQSSCDRDAKRKAHDLARAIKDEDARRLLEADVEDDKPDLTMAERKTIPMNLETPE